MEEIKPSIKKLADYVNTPKEDRREGQLLSFINKNIYNKYMQKNFNGEAELLASRKILRKKANESLSVYKQFPFLNEEGLDLFYKNLKPLIAAAIEVSSDVFINKIIKERKTLIEQAVVKAYGKGGTGLQAGLDVITNSKIHKQNKQNLENVFKGLSVFFDHLQNMPLKASRGSNKRKVIVAGNLRSALDAWNIAKKGQKLTSSDLKFIIAGYYEFLVEEAIIQVLKDKKLMNELKKKIKIGNNGIFRVGTSTALMGGEGAKGDVTAYVILHVKKELEKFQNLVLSVSVKSTNFFGANGKTRRSPVVNFGKVPIDTIRVNDTLSPNKIARDNWYMLSNLYYITQSKQVLERVEYASKVVASHFVVEAIGLDKNVVFIVVGNNLIKGYEFINAAADGFFDFHLGKFTSNFSIKKTEQFLAPMDDVTKTVDKDMRNSIRGKYKNPNFYTNYIISKINHNLIYLLAEREQDSILNVDNSGIIINK